MKKALKIIGKILLALLILLIVFIIVMTVINQILLKKEEKLLKDYPGEFVEVDGHKMNIFTVGEGEHTLVFMPPAADTAPVFTFRPLYSKLSSNYKCAVVEKFGYGMSDVIDTDRSFETIVRQDREALIKSGVEAPYILCPYSMSGIEALMWAQMYPDEVEGIISIDMAFPDSYSEIDAIPKSTSLLINAARKTGIIRLLVSDSQFPEYYSDDDIRLERTMIYRKFFNKCMVNEAASVFDDAAKLKSKPAPDVPMQLFITTGKGTGMDKDTWRGIAEKYTDGITYAEFIDFDCGHGEIISKENEIMCIEMEKFIERIG